MTIEYGNNALSIVGSGNYFVVVYSAAAPVFPPELAAFVSFDQGPVLSIVTGGTDVRLAIDHARFVVEYIQPPGLSGNNLVTIDGGGNAFAVVYEPSFVTTGSNKVAVTGDGSRFVVAYQRAASNNSVIIDGNLNQFAIAHSLPQSSGDAPVTLGMDPSVFSPASRDNNGLIVGTPGSDMVSVNGSGNLFVIQYAAPPGSYPGDWTLFPSVPPVSVAEPASMALLAFGLLISRLPMPRRGHRES